MVASVVIGQLFGGGVFSETARRVMYFSFFFLSYYAYWYGIIVKITEMYCEVFVLLVCTVFFNNILITDDTGNAQSLHIFKLIFCPFHFWWETEKLSGFSSKVIVDILKVHNVYFKTVILLVDIRLILLLKVTKKIKSTSQKAIFRKNVVFWKVSMSGKTQEWFWGSNISKPFPKTKMSVSFRSCIQNFEKKVFLPKNAKTMSYD